MPYSSVAALPQAVREALPAKARRQFLAVVNSQLERGLSEERAFASAWATIKESWYKGAEGRWVARTKHEEDAEEDVLAGAVLKQEVPLRYTLGIVYEPLAVDSQGDFATAETIRSAQWAFMQGLQGRRTLNKWAVTLLNHVLKAVETATVLRLDITDLCTDLHKAQGMLGDQHCDWDDSYGDIVECYCLPCDGEIGGQIVKAGTWLLGVVWSPSYFTKIQQGERTGYSLGGRSRRRWVEDMAHANGID